MQRALAVVVAAVALTLGNVATLLDHARGDHAPDWPNATAEIPHPADTWRFVVQGPLDTWGARRALQDADDRVWAIDVITGRCADHPARACIKIRFYNEADNRCGQTAIGVHERVIRLNRHYPSCQLDEYRRAVGAHEAGHSLGGDHETVRSWLGQGWVWYGTRFDMDELRVTYHDIRQAMA